MRKFTLARENKFTIFHDKLYSLQEVAKMLRVSDRSIFRYIYGGRLKATKIGYWRIKGSDIFKFMNESTLEELIQEVKPHKQKLKKQA